MNDLFFCKNLSISFHYHCCIFFEKILLILSCISLVVDDLFLNKLIGTFFVILYQYLFFQILMN